MKLKEINSQKEFSFSCIYLWTNKVNGKKYVGQAKNFYKRMSQYKIGKFNKYMNNAITKHGIDNFEITILEKDVIVEVLDEREQFWLDYYKSYERSKGYNICRLASTTRGFKHSKETKRSLSEMTKIRYEDPEFLKKFQGENNSMYGKKHSEEWKKNHSNFLKEKWKEEEYREFWTNKMSGENNHMFGVSLNGELNGMYGKKHSEETLEKMANNHPLTKRVKCVETGKIYRSMTQASKDTGINRQMIAKICNGEKDKHKGLSWEYEV